MTRSDIITLGSGRAEKPNEDVALADDDRAVFLVVDGVSSTAVGGVYPTPSPGLAAAQAFGDAAAVELMRESTIDELWASLRTAVEAGNDAVLAINAQRRSLIDYVAVDSACCVATVARIRAGRLYVAHSGDGAAYIVRSRTVSRITSDHLAHCRSHFRRRPCEADEVYFPRVRRDFRNNLRASVDDCPVGYGVYDGDRRALEFVDYLSIALRPHDRVLITTDGLASAPEVIERTVVRAADAARTAFLQKLADESDRAIATGELKADDRTAIFIDYDAPAGRTA